jgi:DNA-directed RNA polymerase beta subunit
MNENDIETPAGVELYDTYDHDTHRRLIYEDVKSKFQTAFPVSRNGLRVDVADVDYVDPERWSLKEQKEALLKDKYLARRLAGTVTLTDEATGEVLDSRKMSLLRVPFLTERGTFVHGGNDYVSIAQQRLLPGVYTRRKNNGELESQFNVRRGTGNAFRVAFEPQAAQYKLNINQANLHLYSVLKDVGVGDDELEGAWGKEILEANRAKYNSKALDSAFERIVPYSVKKELGEEPDGGYPREAKAAAVKAAFDKAMLNSRVVRKNLPGLVGRKMAAMSMDPAVAAALRKTKAHSAMAKAAAAFSMEDERDEAGDSYVGVGPGGLVDASARLLAVNRGEADTDDRDNLQFKRYYRTHKLLSERVAMDAGKLRNSLLNRLSKTRSLKSIPPFYFDSYMTGHIIGNSLSSPVEETNPLQLADQHSRSTLMGQGGIGDTAAITEDAQSVNPSIFGFISAAEGPESERAGIDTRLSTGTKVGSDGRLYQRFYDRRAGRMRWMSPEDLDGLVVKLPD